MRANYNTKLRIAYKEELLTVSQSNGCKVQEMQNLSKYFFSIIFIWLDRACKTVQENIIQNVF